MMKNTDIENHDDDALTLDDMFGPGAEDHADENPDGCADNACVLCQRLND